MNRIFEARGYFAVPDGTEVSPFLNPTDSNQADVPWGALDDMSIAAGRINPGAASWVHRHPVVTSVTFVVAGSLTLHMKGARDLVPYTLNLTRGQAAVTERGTMLQLQNTSDGAAEVLYICSPAYVFDEEDGYLSYDDAVLVAKTWDELPTVKDAKEEISLYEARALRAEATRRLAKRKGVGCPRLTGDAVRSLPGPYDYLAPDKSEIRLLVDGDGGGFAHCLLPAGSVSSAVRHRTVEELWYVLKGEGEVWRSRDGEERIDRVRQGDSIRIRVDTSFQFRAGEQHDLKLLLATMPPWPGPKEAVPVHGR